MTYQRKIPILECGHEYVREILYGRWKITLIYYIANGVSRPGELQRKIPQASRRVLDVQLNQEIISKTVYDEAVAKVEYRLTAFGLSLLPVVMTVIEWGNKNFKQLKRVTR